jgi:hypothetical protein
MSYNFIYSRRAIFKKTTTTKKKNKKPHEGQYKDEEKMVSRCIAGSHEQWHNCHNS